ncbi:ABC transporter permease [Nocardioides sp.]|uniref:ABC transporter permease n=1 Tax=Nocardioides sp. TaxID=35761 RepID=UPI001A2B9DC9|nr:ABC transporter permease [Nocardioides sp.]MBJ7355873.1 ABC transporter permease [Nocardioides sp.]
MIWLTWRQFRVSAFIMLGALAVGLLVLGVTGPQLADSWQVSQQSFFDQLATDRVKTAIFHAGTAVVYALPAVVGVFWGAPTVARELEAGTSRLVWTQGVTRIRWLATKLGVAGAGAAIVGLGGLAFTWWCAPIDDAVAEGYSDPGMLSVPRLWPELFGSRGVVPLAMTVLALVIGVTAGLLVRRSIAAMAVTLVAVVAVQLVFPLVVQARLLPPKELTTTITEDRLTEFTGRPGSAPDEMVVERIGVSIDSPGAWITSNQTLDDSGTVVATFPSWVAECAAPPGQQDAETAACFDRLAAEGYRQHVEYHPASRFWTLQLIETGLMLGLALVLAGFCFWRIRRDLT